MKKQVLVVTSAAGGGMKSTGKDIKDSMNYWGVGKTHYITQGVWGYDWNNMPDRFMKKIHKKADWYKKGYVSGKPWKNK